MAFRGLPISRWPSPAAAGPPAPARTRARTRAGGHERERERAPASERGPAQWAARAVPTPGKLSLISLPFITNTDTTTSPAFSEPQSRPPVHVHAGGPKADGEPAQARGPGPEGSLHLLNLKNSLSCPVPALRSHSIHGSLAALQHFQIPRDQCCVKRIRNGDVCRVSTSI